MTESQRAMVAAKLANMTVGQPEKKSANLPNTLFDQPPSAPQVSQSDAASMLNVSERSVNTAKIIMVIDG
jgi:hypothetical protein